MTSFILYFISRLVWSLKGNQGNVWKQSEVTLVSKKPFQVLIEGTRAFSYTGDIALDDIFFQDGNCVGLCSSVLPTARVNCGYFGISAGGMHDLTYLFLIIEFFYITNSLFYSLECITKRGCCYDSSVQNVPFCYFHPATCQSVHVVARHPCDPSTTITSRSICKNKGILHQKGLMIIFITQERYKMLFEMALLLHYNRM